MAIPWFRILDAVLGASDIARRVTGGRAADLRPPDESLAVGTNPVFGHLEARLAGVMVAALKEAFDRDSRRLDLEREQLDAERQRAERALQLEILRQAADREIGRLRLLAGVAVVSWIGTLFFSARLVAAGIGAKTALGAGWLFLLLALALSFSAQSRIGDRMTRADDYSTGAAIDSGAAAQSRPGSSSGDWRLSPRSWSCRPSIPPGSCWGACVGPVRSVFRFARPETIRRAPSSTRDRSPA